MTTPVSRFSACGVSGPVHTSSRLDGGRWTPATWTSGLPTQNVVRTFFYDSVGRRLSSDDPDTDDRTNMDGASNSWRYLFNRVGDIVAVRDPRGCGQNFFYDLGGRLRGEQYVSCGEAQSQAAERPPSDNEVSHLSAMTYSPGVVSLDVVYHYDEYPNWATTPSSIIPGTASGVLGRATGVTDRAQRAVLTYDDRGNVTWTARQLALISEELGLSTPIAVVDGRPQQTDATSPSGTVVYDETHTYSRSASFDHAGRPTSMTLPDDPDYGASTVPRIGGSLTYNRRGLPSSATAQIGADSQIIVDSIEYLRDGLVGSLTYGDNAGGRTPTRTSTTYDIRRRPLRMSTTRTAIGTGAAGHELDAVTTVADQELVWDAANNLVATVDHRNPTEWPAGHRPQSTFIRQDALYRVVGAEFEYTQTDGSRSATDLGTDWRDEFRESATADPMRQEVPSMIVGQEASRVVSLTWDWDYLANTTEQTDDRHSFYERSIGSILNGDDVDATRRPSALYLASNVSEGTGANAGWVEVDYGLGGNVTAMTVHGQCVDAGSGCSDPGGSDLSARRAALRACSCDAEQHYVYRWDELNRLAEARRYDRDTMTAGAWQLKVRQRYRYDGSNQRTVKQTLDQDGCSEPPAAGMPCERIALYPYPGDFERRGLVRGLDAYEANAAVGTETQYVVAGARMVWKYKSGGVGTSYDAENRLAVGVGDLIQTTSAVFDVRTGALLESSTYYPNGGRETFLNDDDALTAPEVAGFTGKEGDEEVGVVYFGERYLIPRLGRWASPDPLHVHASGGGEALNSYHYVGGNLLAARDPLGLDASGSNNVESHDGRQLRVRENRGCGADCGSDDVNAPVNMVFTENITPEAELEIRQRTLVRSAISTPVTLLEGNAIIAAVVVGGPAGLAFAAIAVGLDQGGDALDDAVVDAMPVSRGNPETRALEDEHVETLAERTAAAIDMVTPSPAPGAAAAGDGAATGARRIIALGLDEDITRFGNRGWPTGALTYLRGAWQRAGLTRVDWGRAIMNQSDFMASFRDAARNADGIVFDVTSFNPSRPGPPGVTMREFRHIIDPDNGLLGRTTFVRDATEVFWDGTRFVDELAE